MGRVSLLLVDDSPEVGFIVRRIGHRAGHDVVQCVDSAAAWDFLQNHRPDLVLLDVHLAGSDGRDLCRRLRADPTTADLPIALLGHRQRLTDIADTLAAGADFVVFKDLLGDPDQWLRRVGDLVAWQRGWRPPLVSVSAPDTGAECLARLARMEAVAKLGPDVLRILVERAGRQLRLTEASVRAWLTSDCSRFDSGRVAQAAPDVVLAFLTAFAAEVWRVLGPTGEDAVTVGVGRGASG